LASNNERVKGVTTITVMKHLLIDLSFLDGMEELRVILDVYEYKIIAWTLMFI
jgi:hypothetical protein